MIRLEEAVGILNAGKPRASGDDPDAVLEPQCHYL